MNNLNQRSTNLGGRKSKETFRDFDEDSSEHSHSGESQLGEFYSMFEDTIKDISSSVGSIKEAATSTLKQYPVYAILGALAVGFAAGAALKSKRLTH